MDFTARQVIGNYRIIRPLGEGGMAAVYEVEHLKLGVHYALKTFTLQEGHVELFRKRFSVEGKILARLNHPNLVRVIDLDLDEKAGALYYVMDLVLSEDGETHTLADVKPGEADEAQVLVADLGDSEVRKDDPPVWRKQDVVQLDVPVDDSLRMDVGQRRAHLTEPIEDLNLVRLTRLHIRQRMRLAVLGEDKIHHIVKRARLLVEVKVDDPHEVRMVEPRKDLALDAEPLAEKLNVPFLQRKGLQRVMNAEFQMLNLVNGRHPALAKRTNDAIVADDIVRVEHLFFM